MTNERITTEDARNAGLERGRTIASWAEMPEAGKTYRTESDGDVTVESKADAETVMLSACYETESNDRQFSPFELTAYELNEQDDSEELWEAFEDGISDGIAETIAKRLESYTDTDFEPEESLFWSDRVTGQTETVLTAGISTLRDEAARLIRSFRKVNGLSVETIESGSTWEATDDGSALLGAWTNGMLWIGRQ